MFTPETGGMILDSVFFSGFGAQLVQTTFNFLVVLRRSGIKLAEMDRRFLSREMPYQTVANFQVVLWGFRRIGHQKIGLFLLCGLPKGYFRQSKGLFNIRAILRSSF